MAVGMQVFHSLLFCIPAIPFPLQLCLDLVAPQVHARESVCIPIFWSAGDRWALGLRKRGGLGALCTYQWTVATRQA